MRVGYEDVRTAPPGILTQQLLSCSLEEELKKRDSEDSVSPLHHSPSQ